MQMQIAIPLAWAIILFVVLMFVAAYVLYILALSLRTAKHPVIIKIGIMALVLMAILFGGAIFGYLPFMLMP